MTHQLPRLLRHGALIWAALALGLTAAPVGAAALSPTASAEAALPDDEDEGPAFDATALGIRAQQLKLHQGLALGTLGMMALTAALGYASTRSLVRGTDLRSVHLAAGGLTTGLYLATGTLAFTTPPPLPGPSRPWSGIELHRNLAWLHPVGVAGVVGLGLANVLVPDQFTAPHGLAGYATLGLMAASATAVAFGE